MNTTKPTSTTDVVMSQIKRREITMRPRIYFLTLSALGIVAIALTALTVSYLASIVFYWLRIQTADTMAWGARSNLRDSVDSFPWWAAVGGVLLVALLPIIIRKHGTMYRHKPTTIVLATTIVAITLGIGISYANIGHHHPGGTGPRDHSTHSR